MRKMLNESQLLTEASSERLRQHLDKKEPMAFISAHVDKRDDSRFKGLQHFARSHMFGFNKISDGYTMNIGEFSEEESIVVYAKPEEEDELFEFSKKAGGLFDRESVLLVDTNGNAYFYYTKNSDEHNKGDKGPLGELTTQDIKKYFSQIGNKKFKFQDKVVIEEQIDFTFKNIGMPTAYLYIHNRNKIRVKVGKPIQ